MSKLKDNTAIEPNHISSTSRRFVAVALSMIPEPLTYLGAIRFGCVETELANETADPARIMWMYSV